MAQDRYSVALALSILALLLCGRVVAQLLQVGFDVPILPDFESWHSGALPYEALLLSQIVLLALMAAAIGAVMRGDRHSGLGRILLIGGWIYLAIMLARAVIGFAGLSNSAWFNQPLPTAFHLVIAGFLTVLGWHWWGPAGLPERLQALPRAVVPTLSYPTVLLFALCLFLWLTRNGETMSFAAYASVTLGAVAVVAHELLLPYRESWKPSGKTVAWDATYLALVQMLLPAALSVAVIASLPYLESVVAVAPAKVWPHAWPLALQLVLVLLLADFGRYWLHRTAHRVHALWSLHAVHHSPKQLYALNVGRFHPGDKALQFLFDALPFILLGVKQEVLALYFVFYAINGFYQHSNAHVRLGLLNWLIAGPELHRWHHAKSVEVANVNFGNNLIVWDALFGTRYLPAEQQVGELGIGNSRYPNDLFGQTIAPFTISPDSEAAR